VGVREKFDSRRVAIEDGAGSVERLAAREGQNRGVWDIRAADGRRGEARVGRSKFIWGG